MNDPNVVFLVTNSNVKHQLEGSEYSERRRQCENVVKSMNLKSMRDATLEDLESKFYFKKSIVRISQNVSI